MAQRGIVPSLPLGDCDPNRQVTGTGIGSGSPRARLPVGAVHRVGLPPRIPAIGSGAPAGELSSPRKHAAVSWISPVDVMPSSPRYDCPGGATRCGTDIDGNTEEPSSASFSASTDSASGWYITRCRPWVPLTARRSR